MTTTPPALSDVVAALHSQLTDFSQQNAAIMAQPADQQQIDSLWQNIQNVISSYGQAIRPAG